MLGLGRNAVVRSRKGVMEYGVITRMWFMSWGEKKSHVSLALLECLCVCMGFFLICQIRNLNSFLPLFRVGFDSFVLYVMIG